jgi:hypothetical protein
MMKMLSSILGIFKEDSPVSASRIGFFVLIVFGMYMGERMISLGRPGIEIAAVIGACFSAATALKIVSKKYEVSGYSETGSQYMYRSRYSDNNLPGNGASKI